MSILVDTRDIYYLHSNSNGRIVTFTSCIFPKPSIIVTCMLLLYEVYYLFGICLFFVCFFVFLYFSSAICTRAEVTHKFPRRGISTVLF